MEVVFYSGKFINFDNLNISNFKRALNYGDGFFESIKIINSKPVNFKYHLERIYYSMKILKFENIFINDSLNKDISKLIKLNKITSGSMKIQIFRSGDGKYLPTLNTSEIIISTKSGFSYKKNNAISLVFYKDEYKNKGKLATLKSSNSLIYILASIYAKNNNYNNAIIFNYDENIIEASNANLFIVKDQEVITPPIKDGCVDGVMRRWITNNLSVQEKSISINQLLAADEIFISNTISGIIPVKKVNNFNYLFYHNAVSLQKKLISSSMDL